MTTTNTSDLSELSALCDAVEAREMERATREDIEPAHAVGLNDYPMLTCVGSSMLARRVEREGLEAALAEAARVMAHVVGERCAVAYGTTWVRVYREADGRHGEPLIAVDGDDIGWMARSAEARASLRWERRAKA
tara:strand:+ start:270 stop:674 length:405 start_codon:yes stop_codon:yes gene_type:complete